MKSFIILMIAILSGSLQGENDQEICHNQKSEIMQKEEKQKIEQLLEEYKKSLNTFKG